MVTASNRAVAKLREQLLDKLLDAGIGFRILVTTDGSGTATFSIKVDRQRKGDEVIDSGEVKLFLDQSSTARLGDFQLDYKDGPGDGFFFSTPQRRENGQDQVKGAMPKS